MGQHISDVDFSRLVVGTVQFGLPYGIANRTGQPSLDQVCEILQCAIEHGVTTLDTAAEYGDSEIVLGKALAEIGAVDQVTLVSKARLVRRMEQERTPESVRQWLTDSVTSSLQRLGIEALPLCLFHDTPDIVYVDIMLDLKKQGLIQHVGASVRTPDLLDQVLSTPGIEAIQIGTSMLDQRILRAGGLARAAAGGVAVFVRSVYLQGLIVMPIEDIIPELHGAVPALQALHRICAEAGLTMPEMALRYALSLPGVTGALTGVETVEQMAANATFAARGPLPPDLVEEINAAVPDLPEAILFPWHWPGAIR